MPPSGYEPFLRSICAEPEDDTVRLVYADWLEENGEPERAEFIRIQVERARLRASGTDSDDLARRDLNLRHTRGDEWRRELPRLSGVNWHRFWRGFVSGADVIAWRFYRDQADSVFAATPVQFLNIGGLYTGNGAPEFTCSPYLSRLRGLILSQCYFGGHSEHAFWASPTFANLEWIELREIVSLPEWRARAIIESPTLGQLKELRISGAVEQSAIAPLRNRFGDGVRWLRVVA